MTDANSSQAERKHKPILSIRARLILLALIAVVPLLLGRVQSLEAQRAERIRAAQAEAMELARRGAESHAETIKSARAVLQVMVRSDMTTQGLAGHCQPLSEAASGVPWLRSLHLTLADGRIVCSSLPRLRDIDISDRAYFRKTVASRSFALSDYLIGRLRNQPTIMATQPLLAADGSIQGILVASLGLEWVERLTGAVGRRDGASVALIDGRGRLIARHPAAPEVVGRSIAGNPAVSAMLAHDEGVTFSDGLDGVRRIVAYVRVPFTESRLVVGLDERAMLSSIDQEIGQAYLELGLFALLALVAAWFGGERLIVDPIRALARTVTRVGRGELDARISRDGWVAEFAPLAEAFDEMTKRLAQRDRELRAANRHFEELASIDGLCALANRRAFDARIGLEWENALAQRQPLGLLLFDVDHFKSFNDGRGHLEGDNCLRQVGEALASVATGKGDFAARYGGDEFALLLPGGDEAHALAVAERLRRAVEALQIPAPAPSGRVTLSIGAASLVPSAGETPDALIAAADMGLYAAKDRGRDTVVGHAAIALAVAS